MSQITIFQMSLKVWFSDSYKKNISDVESDVESGMVGQKSVPQANLWQLSESSHLLDTGCQSGLEG